MKTTALKKSLREHHVNMIAFSACIGVGLFLQSGRVVCLTGPGMAVICYILIGTVMSSTMACLGEMTALFPVQGPLFEFPRRFLDNAIGYAVGWLAWFSWTVILAAEILAVAQLWDFGFDETHGYLEKVGYPDDHLGWPEAQRASPAVWVGLFLCIVGAVNVIPVRQYGQLEFVFGTMKMIFICVLIFFNVIINAMRRDSHPNSSRFWTYRDPYSFISQNFTLPPGSEEPVVPGPAGQLAGVWSAMTTIIWSMIGFETVAITAAENQDLDKDETVKLGTRKIVLRITLLYSLSVLVVGLNVPYNDSNLRDFTANSIRSGQNSIFILAAVRNHVRVLPEFMNGFFIFAATTSGINSLYNSSRLLHALASIDDAWPELRPIKSVQRRLRVTWRGVPLAAVFASWLFGMLAFLSARGGSTNVLGRIATNSSVSMLIVYACVCASYLVFYKTINNAAKGRGPQGPQDTIEPHMRNRYQREAPRYPYRSHLQWLRACYGLFGTSMLALFNGWQSFVPPWSPADFVASYISVAAFALIVAGYHIRSDGYPWNWKLDAGRDIRQPEPLETAEEDPSRRRGRLHLPDEDDLFTRQNAWGFWKFFKVWMS